MKLPITRKLRSPTDSINLGANRGLTQEPDRECRGFVVWLRGMGPCRQCLRTFSIGEEERILFTYQPFQEPTSLPAPGPIFIHAEPCGRYDAMQVPPDFRTLPLVLEAYGMGGR
jgi:hypothetical protein